MNNGKGLGPYGTDWSLMKVLRAVLFSLTTWLYNHLASKLKKGLFLLYGVKVGPPRFL